ncbi:hypothetical protein SDRG_16443 [Saprolegnia diclina VS20]|uniref:Uncharacterized protein n=1 Tax=Saprolegnia diclina (strain VS20) TaxID=1156394 RepID=T0PXE6_SAPDV|nr:hypothetical protein SDRG_16443 [Saprolegnia diclina VS20]EQC25705.1 hypothetical protein SDRG_16443 [Saprolegnia diclina VS20]|eukprot:XP_008620875.1 hypothetical protein SDRG_16443 [Saprolegnia diclina VS20]
MTRHFATSSHVVCNCSPPTSASVTIVSAPQLPPATTTANTTVELQKSLSKARHRLRHSDAAGSLWFFTSAFLLMLLVACVIYVRRRLRRPHPQWGHKPL